MGDGEKKRLPTIFANIYGPPGTGKTTFALTFPGPLFLARFDRRADDLINRATAAGIEVVEEGFVGSLLPADPRGEAEEILERFEAFASRALERGEGTFVIDGGNRLWDIVQRVKLPDIDAVADPEERRRLEKRRRILYGAANEYLHGVLLALEDSPLHVAVTHHTKRVYDERGQETDLVEPDYFRRVPYVANLDVFLFATRASALSLPGVLAAAHRKSEQVLAPPGFHGVITLCKFAPELEGRRMENITFAKLWFLLFGEKYPTPTWNPFEGR